MVDLIVGHENTDFDALGAAVAAQRLHPSSIVGIGRRLSPPVRDFLALHKDRFPVERIDHLDLGAIERLIVVDVRDKRRLAHVQRVLDRIERGAPVEVHVYDHHPASGKDLVGDVDVVEPVGAATTLLVERLAARELVIDAVEATLFALGIYSDTGALTLAGTTSRDARAVAWLLDRGANLAMLNRYLEVKLGEAQRAVLAEIIANARVDDVCGLPVGIATLRVPGRVDGLADITSEACRLLQLAALVTICAVRGRKKVDIVARSRSPLLDVGAALRAVGGGGHRGAASAVVALERANHVGETILAALRARSVERPTVRAVMSSPVHTVAPELSLAELGERLHAWSHSGVPVVRDGSLVGIVSKRDVERARARGSAHLPVSSHMRAEVETTTPETTLDEALAQMVRADVGRLPVLQEGKLVGIVSRSDLLRVLYPRAS